MGSWKDMTREGLLARKKQIEAEENDPKTAHNEWHNLRVKQLKWINRMLKEMDEKDFLSSGGNVAVHS